MAKLTIDTDALLDAVLATAEGVDVVLKRLEEIVLPWRKNEWGPPQWVRMTASGRQVGIVDPHLGGYAQNAHKPRFSGWGFKAIGPSGQGVSLGGKIEPVEVGSYVLDAPDNEEIFERLETEARLRAQEKVDEFLRREFPDLLLLEE